MPPHATESEVIARLGIMPNFFASVSGVPGLPGAMWAFAKSAYLDCPLPSLFKERLFTHLSRFCEIRYCIVRHVGFLMGEGRPAGDPDASPQTVGEVCALLQRPLPDAKDLAIIFARLENRKEVMAIPEPGTQAEYDLFDALTVVVVEPSKSKRACDAVRNAVGDAVFESLVAFIAFVRTAQFWTQTHPNLAFEPDMVSVLERNEGLAKLLLDPADAAESMKAGEALRQALVELEDVRASLRVSTEMLELALQSASQLAWEVSFDTFNIKTVGDPQSTFGFDVPASLEKYLAHVPPEEVPAILENYYAAFTGKPFVDHIEHRLINPSTGETVWVHSTGRLVENGRPRLVGIARNITTEKRREEQLGVLVGELQHRTRNLISVVAAIADRTLRTSESFDDFETSFHDRLGALARVQRLFFRIKEGDRVTFDELLESELSAQSVRIGDDGSVTLDGPTGVRLRSVTVQTLALVLHELVTNALKYGALKQPNGRLTLRWRVGGEDGEPWLHFDWKESGVRMPPKGTAPQGTGHGRELIEQSLRYQFAAQTTYALEADGVHFSLSLPVSKLGRRR